MLHILPMDDHAIVRMGVKDLIRSAFDVVSFGEAGDADQALALMRRHAWDAVVLDIQLPGLSRLEVLARIKRERPEMPVLMLSTPSGPQYAKRCIRAGAAGYVCKAEAADELVGALTTVLEGGVYIRQAQAERVRTGIR